MSAAIERRQKRRPAVPAAELEARLEILDADFYERAMMSRETFLRRREAVL